MGQTDYADFARLGGRGEERRKGKGGYSIVDYLAEEGKLGYRGRALYAIIYNVSRLGGSKFPITSSIVAVVVIYCGGKPGQTRANLS